MSETFTSNFIKIDSLQHLEISRRTLPTITRILVNQMSRRILLQSEFIGLFDPSDLELLSRRPET